MTDFDFDAYLALPRLSHLLLAPDGSRLAVSVQTPAPDGKTMRSSIWQLDPAGLRAPFRLTRSAPGESAGAFLPDGSLLFTSSRSDPDRDTSDDKEEEKTGLWLLPASGGEARMLCAPSGGVDAVRAARVAGTIVFAASVFADAADLSADQDRQAARKKAGVEALLLDGYPIRWWDSWLAPREAHLFATALEAGDFISSPGDLTPNARAALVETQFDVTPDGSSLVTSWRDYSDLTDPRERLMAVDTGTGAQRFLTELDRFWYVEPACSPDGRFVAPAAAGVT